ncbi:MAG: immunogenic protein [Gammaproteobacteria bacterium]|nr:MAG: immunogenic protein [Gammaproteobacteria bacterium]
MTKRKWTPIFLLLTSVATFTAVSQSKSLNITAEELKKIVRKAAEESANNAVKEVLKKQVTSRKRTDKSTQNLPKKQATTKILRIGSGAIGGNYFVLGELVGGVISHPSGSLPCGAGGSCGIMNLQSQNISSAGSVANLNTLKDKTNQTGFVQSDIAYWAYTGTGLYAKEKKQSNLRAIASLYPEAIHIIVNKEANINTIAKLAGKRVSLGAKKSGTLQGARLVLNAYQITEDKIQARYLNSADSIKALLKGELDAVFFTVGTSSPILNELFKNNDKFTLLSIGNSQRQAIFKQGHYFSPFRIAANTYKGVPETKTISVYALWLTTEKMDEGLVYALTKALWGKPAKHLFKSSLIGHHISIENSLKGIGIPLHSGAKKYYDEIGKRF